MTTKPKYFLLVWISIVILFISNTYASCMDCCSDSGKCATAFRGASGMCCGTRLFGEFMKPFCCPTGSDCVESGSEGFKCRLVEERVISSTENAGFSNPPTQPVMASPSQSTSNFDSRWLHLLWAIPVALLLLFLVGWCIYALVRRCLGGTGAFSGSNSDDKTVIRIENVSQAPPVVHRHVSHSHNHGNGRVSRHNHGNGVIQIQRHNHGTPTVDGRDGLHEIEI